MTTFVQCLKHIVDEQHISDIDELDPETLKLLLVSYVKDTSLERVSLASCTEAQLKHYYRMHGGNVAFILENEFKFQKEMKRLAQ